MEKLKQGAEILNSSTGQLTGAVTAAGGLILIERLDLGIKVASAIYLALLIVSISSKLYRDWKNK